MLEELRRSDTGWRQQQTNKRQWQQPEIIKKYLSQTRLKEDDSPLRLLEFKLQFERIVAAASYLYCPICVSSDSQTVSFTIFCCHMLPELSIESKEMKTCFLACQPITINTIVYTDTMNNENS